MSSATRTLLIAALALATLFLVVGTHAASADGPGSGPPTYSFVVQHGRYHYDCLRWVYKAGWDDHCVLIYWNPAVAA